MKIKIKTALVSVSNKAGLEDLVACLTKHKIKIISTGGTSKFIKDLGINVTDVSTLTNFPEIMDGRIKTLHPKVHGGLLARRDNEDHVASQTNHGIENIDLAIINLYPFEETINRNADEDECIENIDIGGPAMLRSAAKNHKFVTVVSNIDDYKIIIEELDNNDGYTSLPLRKELAAKTFAATAYYDTLVSDWFLGDRSDFRESLLSPNRLVNKLRYGENPHQAGALYKSSIEKNGIPQANLIQGKELSYNNINDANAALQLIKEFGSNDPTVAIIKHANPCGVASGKNLTEAYEKALSCDQTSAFGGIIALNQKLDEHSAKKIIEIFTEVIVAPDISDAAINILKNKTNIRVLIVSKMHTRNEHQNFKSIEGGLLMQSNDNEVTNESDLKIVTKIKPSGEQISDLLFAFKVCKHVKSNAIVYVKNKKTIGIGAGQMSRLDSANIATQKNSEMEQSDVNSLENSVVASDAFFPFADGLLVTVASGAKAVIQPGGSMKDEEVIKAADESNISMVFTGIRHFKH